MAKRLALFPLLAVGLAACTMGIRPAATPSPAPLPGSTASPIPALTPTITASAPLQTGGSRLLFTHDHSHFTIMDAEGGQQRQFQLPEGYGGWSRPQLVSADGKWLAYYTGIAEQKPYNLALHVYNLEEASARLVAKLIAPGFPWNLQPLAKTVDFTDFPNYCDLLPECQVQELEYAFRWGIRGSKWSPDGKLLAFAAQIDGPSSDIYLFKAEDGSVRRLTAELESIWSIDWSPDGERILYQDAVPGTAGTIRHFRVADPRDQNVQDPPQLEGGSVFLQEEGWLDESSYLIWSGGEGAPPHRLRYIDTDTQEVHEIWKHTAATLILDRQKHLVILVTGSEARGKGQPEKGVYAVARDGAATQLSAELYYPFDQDPFGLYFATYERNQMAALGADGTIVELQRKRYDYENPRVSPDQKWVLIPSNVGTELYTETLQLYRKVWDQPARILWRPDSLGAFLFLGTRMYYLPVPDGEPVLLKDCGGDSCWFRDYAWLP